MAFFEVAATVAGSVTALSLIARTVQEWVRARRSSVQVKVTLSSGEEIKIEASNSENVIKILDVLTKIQNEQNTQRDSPPSGEGQ